jgi:hypothetical protein
VPSFSEKPNEPLNKPAGLMDRFVSAVDICVDAVGSEKPNDPLSKPANLRDSSKTKVHFGGDQREV